MRNSFNDGRIDEQAFIRMYMDLTGATESGARNVCMYVGSPEQEEVDTANGINIPRLQKTGPIPASERSMTRHYQAKARSPFIAKWLQPSLVAIGS